MAKFQIGSKICWPKDFNLYTPGLNFGTITKMTTDGSVIWLDSQHKPEDCLYAHYAFPVQYAYELGEILTKRAELKKAFDESMSLIYQLNNKITLETSGENK